jgi:preprotein translocase subunit SecG
MEVKQVNAVEIILGILVILVSLVIIVAVLLQPGRRAGISGAISGGADTFLSKNKARHLDAILPRWTKYLAIAFFVLVILMGVLVAVF